MADIETGMRRSTRECLYALLERLAPVAQRLGSGRALERASQMIEVNGAVMQRRIAQEAGAEAVARWLAEGFLEPWAG